MLIKWYNELAIQFEMIGMALHHPGVTRQQTEDLQGLFAVGRLLDCKGCINRNHEFVFAFDRTPLPTSSCNNLTFDQVALHTAQDLWHTAKGRPIVVFWSGGIDSTTALVALLQTNSRWKTDLRVYTTEYAIQQEYPWFYQQYRNLIEFVILPNQGLFDPKNFKSQYLFTDGACGDQLWAHKDLYLYQWDQHYSLLYDHKRFVDKIGLKHRDLVASYIDQQISKFPVSIRTIKDLMWFLNFTHRWDYVRRRHMSRVPDINLFDRMQSFFNSSHFEHWAMANLDQKLGTSWNTLKQPAKDFIYGFTKDDVYRVNKVQHGSMPNSMPLQDRMFQFSLVTDQGHRLSQSKDELIWKSFEWDRFTKQDNFTSWVNQGKL